jgi:hypothetical protein
MAKIQADDRRYLFPFVCLDCRKVFKRPFERKHATRPCPVCGKPATQLSRKFKPPKADDKAQWRKVRYLVEHGFLFQSIYDEYHDGRVVPYPESLREARDWVTKWAHKAIDVASMKPNGP